MKCPGCGAPVAPGQEECRHCHTFIPSAPPPNEAPGAATTLASHPIRWVLLGVLGLAVVGRFVAFSFEEPPAPPPLRIDGVPMVDASGPEAPAGPAAVAIPMPAPEPEKKAEASFAVHSRMDSSGSSFYLFGELSNTGGLPLSNPRVNVVLLDAAGKEVGVDFGYGEWEPVNPGEVVPMKVLVKDPPPHADFRAEAAPSAFTGGLPRAEGLTVESFPPRKDGGAWKFGGSVLNGGTDTARFVHVTVVARDAAGKVVGVDSTYASVDELAPGAKAMWDIPWARTAAEPATFEAVVTAAKK